MPDTDMPDFEYIEEFGHINLGIIDSCLNDDDRGELRQHLKLFGISDEAAEAIIEEIDVCLKKETTRQISAVTTPSASETRRDIKKLLKASSDFLHLYWQAHNYSDYVIDLELESNNYPKIHSIIEGVETLKFACEAALINLRGPNRKKTTKTGFIAVKTDDGVAAIRAQAIAQITSETRDPLISGDTATVPHNFTPAMSDIARIWHSVTGKALSRSRNRVGSGDLSPVEFVHYVLSKVHDGMDVDRAERLIRDYEEALRSTVNGPLRRNEAS